MPDELVDRRVEAAPADLSIDMALIARAKRLRLDFNQVIENALRQAIEDRAKIVEAEIQTEIEAYNAFIREHGSPAEHARQHYAELDDSRHAV
jgi:post-segregation antitoxin (ccd killing protein)